MKNINILYLVYDLEPGGPEIRLLNFAKYFPDNIKMHICVTSTDVSLINEFRRYDVPISIIPVKKPWVELNQVYKIFKYSKINKVEVLNAFDVKGLIIALIIKMFMFNKIKVIYNNVNAIESYNVRLQYVLKKLLLFCDVILCNSEFSKKQIEPYVDKCVIHTIYNGVNTEKYFENALNKNELKIKLGLNTDDIVIGNIANFRYQKNHILLLTAFKKLVEKNTKLILLCVGGGELFKNMQEKAFELGVINRVIFTDYTNDIMDYLYAMDLFVLPSLFEGFPNVILEAMSAKIPVISTNVGGCPEIIQQGRNGIMFSPVNPDELIESVENLLGDNNLKSYLIDNAYKNINEKFSLQIMLENYSKLYLSLSH